MKRIFPITLILLCIMCLTSAAQIQFALGLKAGPNFASINTSESATENYKSRTGFHGGAFALFKFTKIGIQPEIIFSQQGSKVTINSSNYDANYNYVNIPVIVKLYLAAGLNLQAGPQFGFVSLAEAPRPDDNGNITVQDVKDEAKKSDISAALGAGWDLPFGLTIDARYNLGLTKINDDSGASSAKNQVFQVSLGYKLFKMGE